MLNFITQMQPYCRLNNPSTFSNTLPLKCSPTAFEWQCISEGRRIVEPGGITMMSIVNQVLSEGYDGTAADALHDA
jgi:hypothetical protein